MGAVCSDNFMNGSSEKSCDVARAKAAVARALAGTARGSAAGAASKEVMVMTMLEGVMRYSIVAIEYGSDHEVEVCCVDANPDVIVEAVRCKTLRGFKKGLARRSSTIARYSDIRIVDTHA
jgi:hypothetical protein